MSEPYPAPADVTVDSVDWLPSGARSGLVRVRGHRERPGDLPDLVLAVGGETHRVSSLPDPRAGRDPRAWRGAYVIDARPAAEAEQMWLEFPEGGRLPLPALVVAQVQTATAPVPEPKPEPTGQVVDRAVLAERRARRAEASEQAQARIAQEAMRAVEVLELRSTELEDAMAAALAERDALRAQMDGVEARRPEEAAADRRVTALEQEILRLRRELAAAAAEKPAPVIDAGDAERRIRRLRTALTTTIGTVAELRMRLHEADVSRRTREVGHSAVAVQLAAVLAEREGESAALDAARAELIAAQSARDAAVSARVVAETALADLEQRLDAQTTELVVARERIAQLEAEVAAAEIELDRAVAEAITTARLEAEAEAAGRAEERIAAADALTAEAERALEELRERLDEAETARELAEAAAMAAAAERRAASVAQAAAVDPDVLRTQLDRARADLQAARDAAISAGGAVDEVAAEQLIEEAEAETAGGEGEVLARNRGDSPDNAPLPSTAEPADDAPEGLAPAASDAAFGAAVVGPEPNVFAPPRSSIPEPPPELLAAAEAQARAAADAEPATEEREKVVADLDAAAATLREGPTIVSPAREPPSDVARGRALREYPALRGALVKLAHDDPWAAGKLLVGLLGAQHALLAEPVDYDLSIREVGTFAVRAESDSTLVTPIDKPRGRSHAAFHLRGDALGLTELLAGVGHGPRRMRGAVRASGRMRDARRVTGELSGNSTLADLVAAGADPDPDLVLRGFSYAVRPAWTSGQAWTVELIVDDQTVTVAARHSGGLTVLPGPADDEPDARVFLTREAFRTLVGGGHAPRRVEGDEVVVARLLSLAERARSLGSE